VHNWRVESQTVKYQYYAHQTDFRGTRSCHLRPSHLAVSYAFLHEVNIINAQHQGHHVCQLTHFISETTRQTLVLVAYTKTWPENLILVRIGQW